MAIVKSEKHRVLGRLVARELTEDEMSSVSGGLEYESVAATSGTCTRTTANGCPNGDYSCD